MMKKLQNRQLNLFIIILLAIALLTPGFYRNQWQAAGRKWFYDWRKAQEHMVIARLVESRQNGPFSSGALLGFGNITTWDFNLSLQELEYQVYLDQGTFQSYFPYTSHPGFQGIFFSFFQEWFQLSPRLNLKLFQGAVSLLTALALGLFIYWLSVELGWLAGIFSLLAIALSEWMTLFGGNIFWNLWAFYLPLVAASFYLMKTSKGETYRQFTLSLILAITVLIKCLFTGFEYISTALIMPLVPIVFYAIRDSWGWRQFIRRSILSSLGLAAGLAGGLLILVWQIRQIKSGFQEAIIMILETLGKRTYGDPSKYGSEAESLNAELWPVIARYIQGRAINLGNILHLKNFPVEINYLALFILFMSFTLVLLMILVLKSGSLHRAVGYAILGTTWVSAAAPLSWFILFKAHSYVHTQMNFIVWQMPFALYGFALCGYTIERVIRLLPTSKTRSAAAQYTGGESQ